MDHGLANNNADKTLGKRLDEAAVLRATTDQLRKDLSTIDLLLPATDDGAFEALRSQVLKVLEERQATGAHAFGLVLNRVDITERQFREAVHAGGLEQLAALVVFRCLQKVLARERYAGRG